MAGAIKGHCVCCSDDQIQSRENILCWSCGKGGAGGVEKNTLPRSALLLCSGD